jgi:putative peptidoglycan lipid II flippase
VLKKLSFLTRVSLLLGFFFTLDKVLGFVRTILIARQFQLSYELDAFNAANNLPNLLFVLISGGGLSMALIPVLSEYLTAKGRRVAWDLFSRVGNLAFLVTITIAVVIAIFAGPIVRSQIGIAPGFSPDRQRLIAQLMQLNLIATCIFSLSGLVTAGLQTNQHFFLPALAPILYNVGQIFGVLVLSPTTPYTIGPLTLPAFGFGVQGLVYGVIIGAVLHLAIQIPGLIRYQFHWIPAIDIRNTGVIEVLRVLGPRLLTMFLIQLMFIARDNLASRLGQVGAITSLTYGWMIMQVPETLIGTAIATAILPTLAELASRGNWADFRTTVEKAFRVVIVLSLPVTAVMAAGIRPLVAVAFHFDAAGTALLTWTTRVYLLTLAGYNMQEIMARAFYSRREAIYPLYSALIRIGLYLLIGISVVVFFRRLGAPAIAAAELSLTVEALIMLVWLNRRLEHKVTAWSAFFRGLGAAVLSGLAAYALALYLPGPAFVTALVGMAAGGLLSLPIIWPDVRLLLRL